MAGETPYLVEHFLKSICQGHECAKGGIGWGNPLPGIAPNNWTFPISPPPDNGKLVSESPPNYRTRAHLCAKVILYIRTSVGY